MGREFEPHRAHHIFLISRKNPMSKHFIIFTFSVICIILPVCIYAARNKNETKFHEDLNAEMGMLAKAYEFKFKPGSRVIIGDGGPEGIILETPLSGIRSYARVLIGQNAVDVPPGIIHEIVINK